MRELFKLRLPSRRVDWTNTTALKELPDAILVRETKGGSDLAYGELIRRYQDRLFTVVYGLLLNREDAVFYTWVYRIAVNACIDFKRRRQRAQDPFSLDDEFLAEAGYEPVDERPSSDPERVFANKEMRARLHLAIDALSEPLRVAVLLHDVEGLSQKEIAEIMKCPLGTVKSRIQRGRSELRHRLAHLVEGEDE